MDGAAGQSRSPPSLKSLCVKAIREKRYSNKKLVLHAKIIIEGRHLNPIPTNPVLMRLREGMYEVYLLELGAVKRLKIANAWPPKPFVPL